MTPTVVTVGATEAYCLESAGAYRVVGWRRNKQLKEKGDVG